MKNVKIVVLASVSKGTDIRELRERVTAQLLKITNNKRDDEGLISVESTTVTPA